MSFSFDGFIPVLSGDSVPKCLFKSDLTQDLEMIITVEFLGEILIHENLGIKIAK
jgi:hypothetical protein